MDTATIYLVLACLFGFLMAWGVGANDVSNAMGTSVGSKALTIRQAIIIATIFEFLGAFLAGGQVTETIQSGIIEAQFYIDEPMTVALGMIASLLSAAIWLGIASYFGWPVSTSHSIVGAIVGFAVMSLGFESVQWHSMTRIALSWIISPLLGGVIAYSLYISVLKCILLKRHPFVAAKRVVPLYIFLVGWVVSLLTVSTGLEHVTGIELSGSMNLALSVGFGISVMLIGIIMLNRIKIDVEASKKFHFANVEKLFGVLMLFTACAMAYAHGSNDVANAIGPLSAVVTTITNNGPSTEIAPSIPVWILALGSFGIVIGLITYGHRVIQTIGTGITELTPTRGFAATLAAAITVQIASGTGLPISTTHTLVGAVLGVGLAKGINALDLGKIRTIFLSWLVTLPAGAGLAIIAFELLKFAGL